jgi:methionyl-tRNA synthetase
MERLPHALEEVGGRLEHCDFRQALGAIMALAQTANRYIDERAPWRTVKTDLTETGTTLWVCLNVLSCLRVLSYPFLPFSGQKLHQLLGFTGDVQDSGWVFQRVKPGQSIPQPKPLFSKLEESVVEEELGRLRAATG